MKAHAVVYACGAVVLLGSTAPAFADDYYYHSGAQGSYYDVPPVQMQLEAGGAVTTGQTSNFLNDGWTVGVGLLWHPQPGPLAIRTSLDFTRLGATQEAIEQAASLNQTAINGGFGEVTTLHLGGLYEWPVSEYTRAYLTAAAGGSWERVDFTQTFAATGAYCDWWVCGRAYYPDQVTVARNDTTRFSWDAGVGFDFSAGGWESWFIEATFQKVNTPQPTTFIPIRVGVRF